MGYQNIAVDCGIPAIGSDALICEIEDLSEAARHGDEKWKCVRTILERVGAHRHARDENWDRRH
jgi:hypothetical protein